MTASPKSTTIATMHSIPKTKQRHKFYPRSIGIILLGFMSACSPRVETVSQPTASLRQPAAIELFTKGYRQISDKFIEPVTISKLALEGMKGLSAIDPELIISRHRSSITLSAHDLTIKSFQTPNEHNASAWAGLTVQLWREARAHSISIQNAQPESIYEAIFDGMLSKLDRYSRYAGKKQARKNRNRRDGFGGIGIRFRYKREIIHISRVLKNTPAAHAGLKRGDIITHVGDVPLKGLKSRDIISQLHGPIQSVINITVRRPDRLKPLTFEIERALIVPNTVTSRVKNGIAIIRIRSFNQKTSERTAKHILKAQTQMRGNFKGVILDLRGNPGGLLKQSIKVADLFLTQSSIVSTRGRHPDSFQYYEANFEDILKGLPLAVLIDGKSASASEVLAAALQDSGRAIIIGTTSYGKGTVQSVIRLPNEGEVTLTWSRLHSPAGYVFHKLGVFPSICTSGKNQEPSQLIKTALSKHQQLLSTYQLWWQSNGVSRQKRNDLREICPPERRKNKLETEVALQILADTMLYARAMMSVPELAQKPLQSPDREISSQPTTP
jgi:carboxyl-terminal processing protease